MGAQTRGLKLAIIICFVCLFSPLAKAGTSGSDTSSACIKCHTNFEAMDNYSAKAAEGSAGIAG